MALAGNLLPVHARGKDEVRDSSPSAILFITQWNRPLGVCVKWVRHIIWSQLTQKRVHLRVLIHSGFFSPHPYNPLHIAHNNKPMVTATWLYRALLRVQWYQPPSEQRSPFFPRQRSAMPDKNGLWSEMAPPGTWPQWWENDIFHFRHLHFKTQPRPVLYFVLWNSSNSQDWGGGIIYWIGLWRTNISLPLGSPSGSLELYETDRAVWNGPAAEAEGNANAATLYSQHPSDGSIKEAKAVASGLTARESAGPLCFGL